jgi:hypothetical protein
MAKPTYSQTTVNTLSNQRLKVCNSVADLPAHAWTAADGSPSVVYNGAEYPTLDNLYEGWIYNFVAYVTDTETFGGGIITKINGDIKVITGEKPALLRKQILNIGDTSYEVTADTPLAIAFNTFSSLFGETITLPLGSKIIYRPGLTDEIVLTLNEKVETVEGSFTANVTPNKSGTIVKKAVAYGHRILLANDTIPPVPADLKPLSDINQTTGAGNGTLITYFNARILLAELLKNYIAAPNATLISYLTTEPSATIDGHKFPSGFRCFTSSGDDVAIAWTGVDIIVTKVSTGVSGYVYIPNDAAGGLRELIFSYAPSTNPNGVNRNTYASDEDFVTDTKTFAQYFVDYQDLFEVNDRYGWDIKQYGEMTPVGGDAVEVYAPPFDPSEVSPYNDPAIMNIACWK